MVTCPLLKFKVNGPAGMAVTRLAGPVLATVAGAVPVLLVELTPGSPSGGSTNRRRQCGPVGGEL